MLSSIYIENIAVIEKASIDFDKGLTVLTGETGAGKSIIIDSINAILGERTSKELIRTGAKSGSVSALFTEINQGVKDVLNNLEIPFENDELQIYRSIGQSKSASKVNGMPITATMLKEIGKELISINGQHDSYDLLSPEIHGRYVDTYGKLEPLIHEYSKEYRRLRELKKELDALNTDENQKARRIDMLNYQIEEIENADLQIGQKEQLRIKRDFIRNSENILKGVAGAKSIIGGDGDEVSTLEMLGTAENFLEDASKNYQPLETQLEKIREIQYLLEDVNGELRSFMDSFQFDPQELDELEERLDELYKLSLKYGETEEDILNFLTKAKEELMTIELSEERVNTLMDEFEISKAKAIKLAKEISLKRKKAGMSLAEEVKVQLNFLNMPSVEFAVEQERVTLNPLGCDKIQFLVSTNPGEAVKPLSKVASGGELSRIMLAIKTILSQDDVVETLIFDEIDSGISGETAHKVGLKLKEASKDRQVICITHLAQIAAMAENQLYISKVTDGQKTFTKVKKLSREERLGELARIIGGDEITPLKLKMAEEMLLNS